MTGSDLPTGWAERFRTQAEACGDLGSPLYAALMSAAADDVLAGGPVAAALRDEDPGDRDALVPLRLFGAVHRLVLERRAPALALHYPSVGGTPGAAAAVALLSTVDEHLDEVRAGLAQPPQTNDVGRSAALIGGLQALAAERPLPVRLLELGASAGLNLRADRYRFLGSDGSSYGPSDSPVQLRPAWPVAPSWSRPGHPLRIVERLGVDVSPVDPTTTDGRLRLTSYVWPDQLVRLERLRSAFQVAAHSPVDLRRGRAPELLGDRTPSGGAWTVLWHSLTWQYLPAAEADEVRAQLAALGRLATTAAPLAHLSLEPPPRPHARGEPFDVRLTTWPGGRERLIGTAPPHGLPVTWSPA